MSGTDDYIIITGSRNLDDDTASPAENLSVPESESDDVSNRALQKQGIFLEKSSEMPVRAKQLNEFSKELFEQSGIEIFPAEGEESEA